MDLYYEWLMSNERGSYSSSTFAFANTRTYHGLLVVNTNEYYDRYVLLSKISEEIGYDGEYISIDTNFYEGGVYPDGFKYIYEYRDFPYPSVSFKFPGDRRLKKSIVMDKVSDLVIIRYEFQGERPKSLVLTPLIALRSFHRTLNSKEKNFDVHISNFYVFSDGKYSFSMNKVGKFYGPGYWYYNFRYPREEERGTNSLEDLYNPGRIVIDEPEDTVDIEVFSGAHVNRNFDDIAADYEKSSKIDVPLPILRYESSKFVLKDNIIAGFHWFGPWGRDAFISLPGLLLIPGMYDKAANVLRHYSEQSVDGLILNSAEGGNVLYSADSSLWFVYAIQKFYEYTKNKAFLREMYNKVQNIIYAYLKGNENFHIEGKFVRVTGSPMTWMDAVIDGKAVTPRSGLPIEINALWYNTLKAYTDFSALLGKEPKKEAIEILDGFEDEFKKAFVRGTHILDIAFPDDYSFRPNFLFAYFLPYPLLKDKIWIDYAIDKLVTPYGLRSLDPSNPSFIGKYAGDRFSRDNAYHNGTVWPYLAGIFIKAAIKVGYDRIKLLNIFKPLFDSARIPEIYDGINPGVPRGCIMQAWSHGEVIRSYYEDILEKSSGLS
ncbi:TVG0419177 [Thermoplasma volcanium GSS1]|uniref:TVG0419177 protein n=1 Tax=Thermoplasma volcanium (strain ATCC 51530 / DSM 4299 / JCM 9571 / NBRC 15438 / GSS1) TaxID=273116 RepID=Q97BM6_THEVO|nr:amylo-alpha-1,6-glucosidase [Thermoplasma volcanium]BAB59571.1 TVG0419177 [Thermoplasma volcanium GSS1]